MTVKQWNSLFFGMALVAAPPTSKGAGLVIEEIIVTAEKVAASLQDTPIAITAMDERFIEDFGLTEAEDIALYIPSFSRTEFDFAIRGIGRNFRTLGGDPGVATYQNGVYSEDAFFAASEGNLYDVHRIEVLRGPQGTLYGRNAIGGVVNFLANPPTTDFQAEFMSVFGDHSTEEYYGFVSGPLVRNVLNARLVATNTRQAGDRTSRAVPGQKAVSDTGGNSDSNVALSLEILPMDNVEIYLRAINREFDSTPRAELHIGEGSGNRRTRSSAVCFPVGTDCFNESVLAFTTFPQLNSNANQNLPISGNGYGDNLDNVAYPDYKPSQNFDHRTVTVDARWRFGYERFTLRYIGGYSNSFFYRDIPWNVPGGRNRCIRPLCTPGAGGEQVREDHFEVEQRALTYSHEVQFLTNLDGPWELVAGVFYYKANISQQWDFRDPTAFGTLTDNPNYGLLEPCCGPPSFPGRHNVGVNEDSVFSSFAGSAGGSHLWMFAETDTRATAAYVQTHIDLSDDLTLTVGGRWSRDEKTGYERRWLAVEVASGPLDQLNALLTTDSVTGAYNGDPLRLVGFPLTIRDGINIKDAWEEPTWRANIDWRPKDSSLAYASVTTGYRSGGFNLGFNQRFPYQQETVVAYELGYKADLWRKRLRVNGAVYLYDYENHQVLTVQPVPCNKAACDGPATTANLEVVDTVPEARAWGVELESTIIVTPQLTVGGLYSYMDAEIVSDFIISKHDNDLADTLEDISVNARGFDLTRSPKHKFTVWLNYAIPFGRQGTVDLLTSYAYTDEQYQDVLNVEINKAPSFYRWDARVVWDSPAEKYRVAAYVNNITNTLGIISQETSPNLGRRAVTTAPRTWGVQFRLRFGGTAGDM